MTRTKRLSARQLGITREQYDALLWVRSALDPEATDTNLPDWLAFDMRTWIQSLESVDEYDDHICTGECGTAACIGGAMEIYLLGLKELPTNAVVPAEAAAYIARPSSDGRPDELPKTELVAGKSFSALFYNYNKTRPMSRRDGVAAIDQFLLGNVGDPWLTGYIVGDV